ncbi:MAG TPA: PhoH family protein, partial [bacterium]|nr:PhoH family protein [bacterium]
MEQDQFIEQVVELADHQETLAVCGHHDEHLRYLSGALGARIVPRGNILKIIGSPEPVGKTRTVLEEMLTTLRRRGSLKRRDIKQLVMLLSQESPEAFEGLWQGAVRVPSRKKIIKPMSPRQADYLKAIQETDVVFGIGPAGTGKTYLAMAMA